MYELDRLRDELDLEVAFLTGIGAIDRVTLGHYDVEGHSYGRSKASSR